MKKKGDSELSPGDEAADLHTFPDAQIEWIKTGRKGLGTLPQWLLNQMMRAYRKKDLRQIRMLNDCWFFYRAKAAQEEKQA